MKEAQFWKSEPEGFVQCTLCRFFCRIAPGRRGRCGVRENRDGTLFSLVYGRCVAESTDPVEKKPLYHVLPGSLSYSVATVGCNLHCLHCQNHHLSQPPFNFSDQDGEETAPELLVQRALRAGCRSVAYTYTEPTIFLEYVLDTARIAREKGLLNLLVTNGYTSEEALRSAAPLIDAVNVDLKGFSETFYREVTGASLQGVLETLKLYRELGIWLEVTTLLIPGHNDDETQIREMTRFIARELGTETPWHLSAFFPTFKLTSASATTPEDLFRAQDIGREAGLKYIYLGNVRTQRGRDTYCPVCGQLLVERQAYQGRSGGLDGDFCRHCGAEIAGLWQAP